MASKYTVKAKHNVQELYKMLDDDIKREQIEADVSLNDGQIDITVEQEQGEKLKEILIHSTCDFILNHMEQPAIHRIIRSSYPFFSKEDMAQLSQEVQKQLHSRTIDEDLFLIRRKKLITMALHEYFDTNQSLFVDGFVPFRLQRYLDELEEFVDQAADDYVTYKEYNQFLGLLRYFVSIQESLLKKLQIISFENGRYALLDEDGIEVSDDSVSEFLGETDLEEISFDDLLISNLITLAPKEILIHNHKNMKPEIMDTILQVFDGKVALCSGCILCELGGRSGKYLN